MVREVGALVAVRRSVADVDWIQQVQSCVSATLAKLTAQADEGGVDEDDHDDGTNGDGGGRQMANGVARAASDAGFARFADSVSTILSTLDCEEVERAVARWRAGLARVAQQKGQTERESSGGRRVGAVQEDMAPIGGQFLLVASRQRCADNA